MPSLLYRVYRTFKLFLETAQKVGVLTGCTTVHGSSHLVSGTATTAIHPIMHSHSTYTDSMRETVGESMYSCAAEGRGWRDPFRTHGLKGRPGVYARNGIGHPLASRFPPRSFALTSGRVTSSGSTNTHTHCVYAPRYERERLLLTTEETERDCTDRRERERERVQRCPRARANIF